MNQHLLDLGREQHLMNLSRYSHLLDSIPASVDTFQDLCLITQMDIQSFGGLQTTPPQKLQQFGQFISRLSNPHEVRHF